MNHQNGRSHHQIEDCHQNGRNAAKMNTLPQNDECNKVNEPTTRLDIATTRMEYISISTLRGATK